MRGTITDESSRTEQAQIDSVNQALAEILELRNKALEAGNEIGRYHAIIEVNDWLRQLTALLRDGSGVNGKEVRTVGLMLLRGISAWLNQQPDKMGMPSQLKAKIAATIEALEQWRP